MAFDFGLVRRRLLEVPADQRPEAARNLYLEMVASRGNPVVDLAGECVTALWWGQGPVRGLASFQGDLHPVEGTELHGATWRVPGIRRAVLRHSLFLKGTGRSIPTHEACTWPDGIWRGPEAPPPPDELEDQGAPTGTVEHHTVGSRHLGEERRVTLYRPPDGMRPAWVLYSLDGPRNPRVLDNLQARREVPPVAAVGIADHPQRRNAEYQGIAFRALDGDPRDWHRRHEAFLAEEVLPWAEGLVAPAPGPRPRRLFAGASAGAFGALHFALSHPGLVDSVLCQSVAGPEGPIERLVGDWPAGVPLPRAYFTAGVLEAGMLLHQRTIAAALAERGAAVRAEEPVRGHDAVHWRETLPDGLRWCLI